MKKYFLLVLLLGIIACKSDKPEKEDNSELELRTEQGESEKYLQNIARAYNASKFKEESQVKFKLRFSIEDEVFFDGFVTLKTDGSQARFLDSNIDTLLKPNNLETELQKKLYWIAEIYSMGFWMNIDSFSKAKSESENFTKVIYRSPVTESIYTIFTHPLTDIVQHVKYETDISEEPFKSGTLFYEKYITVNRIPVSLLWKIQLDNNTIAMGEITRISYPDNF